MTTPVNPPTSTAVAEAWLRLAVPGVHAGTRLPAVDQSFRESGAIRLDAVGGTPDRDVPIRAPVVGVSCWFPPQSNGAAPWGRAEQLAERLVAATYNPDLQGVRITGKYAPARVLAVLALSEPVRIENDPSDFARYDVDLLINWRSDE